METNMERGDLTKLSPEALIEGFVTEAKLEGLGTQIGTVAEMNEHGAKSRAYAAEIAARGGLPSLLPLLDSPDNWIAFSTADRLADLPETRDRALATLDRIADERSGGASFEADTARNLIRYGTPSAPSTDVSGER